MRAASGANLEGARADVKAALALLDARTAPGEPARFDDVPAAFETLATLISTYEPLKGGSGLFLTEQIRQLVDGVPHEARITTVADLKRALALPENTVGYYFLFGNSTLLTWVIRNGDVQLVERPIAVHDVIRLTNQLAVRVTRGAPRNTWQPALSQLYELLLRDLPGADSATDIVVIPEGPLFRVPFSALWDPARQQFLFERTAVRVLMNLSQAVDIVTPQEAPVARANLLSIGEPAVHGAAAAGLQPLVRARVEAAAIAKLYGTSSVLLGDQATKPAVLDKLAAADVVHFAGHAVANQSTGETRLLLAGPVTDTSTALSPRDLAGRVHGTHVVLAACETAATPTDRAAGPRSIASAFLRAGAASVVATLWPVDDAAGEEFFVEVHRALARGNASALAVRSAQRACYASPSCRAVPATWIGTSSYGRN
jgi:CHAT domain-containing protein